ncbi:MAG: MltA domain-containing protein, partial [Bdellovibrionales bacterium]|nr:MltA domain-containing protein [Bdellovibrionales bacterium]
MINVESPTPIDSSYQWWHFIAAAVLGLGVGVLAVLFSSTTPSPSIESISTGESLKSVTILPFDDTGSIESLKDAVTNAIRFLESKASPENYSFGGHTITRASMLESYDKLESILETDDMTGVIDYVINNFQPYEVQKPKLLVTGYYEPELEGAREHSSVFSYPLYRVPRDLLTLNLKQFDSSLTQDRILQGRVNPEGFFLPYYTRAQIDFDNALNNKADVLVWLKDPVDAFFLHIQGSGIVTMEDGSVMRVNYAGKNGRAYRAIGKLFIEREWLAKEDVSMQAMKSFLRDHPDLMEEVFSYNPSYVFFRDVQEGPLGNLGVPVTAYRSVATDQSI